MTQTQFSVVWATHSLRTQQSENIMTTDLALRKLEFIKRATEADACELDDMYFIRHFNCWPMNECDASFEASFGDDNVDINITVESVNKAFDDGDVAFDRKYNRFIIMTDEDGPVSIEFHTVTLIK